MVAITPVVWPAQAPEEIAGKFNLGDHGASSGAAMGGWSGTAASWEGIAATVLGAMAKLTDGMEGINGTAALARLTGFQAWVQETAAQSALVSAAHSVHLLTFELVSAVVDEAGVQAGAADATTASAVAFGPFAPAVAEGAQVARNLAQGQSGAAMEAYELANMPTMATPVSFLMPPTIANGVGDINSFLGATGNPISDAVQSAFQGVQGASQTAQGVTQSLQGAAQQIAPTAQSITSAGSQMVSTASNAGSQALSAFTGGGPLSGAGSTPVALGTAVLAGGGALGAVAFGGGLGSAALPDGWGGMPLGSGSIGVVGGGGGTAAAPADAERPVVRPATGSAALGQQRKTREEEEQEHETPDYLKNFEHFSDGRTIGPPVIGAVTEAESGR